MNKKVIVGPDIELLSSDGAMYDMEVDVCVDPLNPVSGPDYNNIRNKPQINGVTLQGNKTLSDLGIQSEDFIVTITYSDGTYSADKTYAEIKTAWQTGKDVILKYGSDPTEFYYLATKVDGPLEFAVFSYNQGTSINQIMIDATDLVLRTVESAGTYSKPSGGIPASDLANDVHLIPAGGNEGQILTKNSGTDYDYGWGNINFPTEVFYATYDVTTADEIKAARQAGKTIFLNYNGRIYGLSWFQEGGIFTSYEFTTILGKTSYSIYLENSVWSHSSKQLISIETTGSLHDLNTTDKSSIVNAINEIEAEKIEVEYFDFTWDGDHNPIPAAGVTSTQIKAAVQDGKLVFARVTIGSEVYPTIFSLTICYDTYIRFNAFESYVIFDQLSCSILPSGLDDNSYIDSWSMNYSVLPDASNNTPQNLGVASPGLSERFSRADHVHAMPSAVDIGAYVKPNDGIPASDLDVSVQSQLFTSEERTKLNGIEAGAEVNVIEEIKAWDVIEQRFTPLPITNKSVTIPGPVEVPDEVAVVNFTVEDSGGNLVVTSADYNSAEIHSRVIEAHTEIIAKVSYDGDTFFLSLVEAQDIGTSTCCFAGEINVGTVLRIFADYNQGFGWYASIFSAAEADAVGGLEETLDDLERNVGDLNNLTTTDKSSVVAAINEVVAGGGSGGTSDYNDLSNKPQIGGTTLSGNKSLSDLGIEPEAFVVTVTESNGTYSADKTATQIIAAANANKRVIAMVGVTCYQLFVASGGEAYFTAIYNNTSRLLKVGPGSTATVSLLTIGTYSLPSGGIPETDLASDVQAKLDSVYNAFPNGTASGAIASFPNGADNVPVKDLTIAIEPVQSGSGDPAPDNVRPISGWTGANINVSPTTDAADGTTYSIAFPSEVGTVYGGTLDVTTGKLTVTHWGFDMGSVTYIESSTFAKRFAAFFPTGKNFPMWSNQDTPSGMLICSKYKEKSYQETWVNGQNAICVYFANTVMKFGVYEPTIQNAEDFRQAVTGQTIVYKLATPIVYDLTPTEVNTLLGTNNIWADTGDSTVNYRADPTLAEESLESDIAAKYTKPGTGIPKSDLVSAVQTSLGKADTALQTNQGSGNAGKFLVVGSDGNVTTMTLATWQGGNY